MFYSDFYAAVWMGQEEGGGGRWMGPGHMESWKDLTMGTYRTSCLGLVTLIADALQLSNVTSMVTVANT